MEYHKWIQDALIRIDEIAQGDVDLFKQLFEKYVADVVQENPWILKKSWWEEYGDEFWEWWDTVVNQGLK